MVPTGLPYPGVYNNHRTLSTDTVFSRVATGGTTSGPTTGRRNLFGLGRKTSKRIGQGNLSISGPMQSATSSSLATYSGSSRDDVSRPAGPRAASASVSSAGLSVEAQPAKPTHLMRSDYAEALTAMADILPHAPRETLARYLQYNQGDQVQAITKYLDDERTGRI